MSLALWETPSEERKKRLCLKERDKPTVDVLSIRVRQASGAIAMSSKPLRLAVVVDAVSASLDIGIQIRAAVSLANAVDNRDP